MSPPASASSVAPVSLLRWRETFFTEPVAELRAAFAREVIWDNLYRARLLAGLTLLLSLLLVAVPDFLLWRSGSWAHTPALRWWLALHLLLAGCALVALVLARSRPRRSPAEVTSADHHLVLGLSALVLALLLASAIVQQHITGQITSLLLGLAVYASCLYSTPREGLGMIGGFAAALILAVPLVQSEPAIISNHIVITSVFATIFWFVSRLIYSLRAQAFNQLHTIATQARSLEDANLELRKANTLKSELIGIAAHDLRDPLNAISGLAQELRHELPPESTARELVTGIGESARRLSYLVENLLTDAERETKGLRLRREPTEMVALIDEVTSDYRWLAGTKDLALETDVPLSGSLTVNVDARRIRQLLENLLSNAIKYSPPKRSIRVILRAGEPTGLHLAVQDQGAGLLPEDQRRIFGKFERLSARPTSGETTSGLGLAIVKAIVEAHNGRVWAESPGRDQGSTFFVHLP